MANKDAAHGLRPVRYQGGAAYTGAANLYHINATDTTVTFIGQLVKPAGSADADGVMSVLGNITTGDRVLGPVVSVKEVTRDSTVHREALTERYVYVADDPNLLFSIQDDAAATPTAAIVGNVADVASTTSGSTFTGISTMELSMASISAAGDSTEDVTIVGLERRVDNEIGDNADWLVRLNNHFLINRSPGA